MTRKTPLILSLAALTIAAVMELSLLPIARADDEMDEELRSTIPSDPVNRGRRSSSSGSAPASSAPSEPASSSSSSSGGSVQMTNGDEEGEWRTMGSESGRRVYSGGGSSSIKVDVEKKRIFTPRITFGSNSSSPTPQSQTVIKQLASTLGKRQDITVRVEGHTDTIGYDQPNLELSQKRADKVRDLLVASGVAAHRVQSVGMGDRYPLASSTTSQGQEKNRRVEVHIAEVASAPLAAAPAPAPAPAAPAPAPAPAPVAPAPAPAPAPVAPAPAPAPVAPAPTPAPAPAPSRFAAPAPAPAPVAPPAPAPQPAPAPAPQPVAPAPAPLAPAPHGP